MQENMQDSISSLLMQVNCWTDGFSPTALLAPEHFSFLWRWINAQNFFWPERSCGLFHLFLSVHLVSSGPFFFLSLQYVRRGFQNKVLWLSLRGSLFQCHPFPHIPPISYQCLLRCRHPAVCAAASNNQSHAEQGRVGTDANNLLLRGRRDLLGSGKDRKLLNWLAVRAVVP